MSAKNNGKYPILTGQSLSSSFISPVTIIRNTDNVSYQIDITTSNSTGTFSVQVSNDYTQNGAGGVEDPGSWVTLTLSGVPTVAAANDDIVISLNQLTFDAIRLVYTSTVAGTGTCDVVVVSKRLGG